MAGNCDTQERLRNKREAAAYLGISLGSLDRLMRAGLPYIKLTRSAGGAVRFALSDLADFVSARRVRPADEA